MKRYRLLKDLPFAKAGAIFKEWTGERSGKEEKALINANNLTTTLWVGDIEIFDEWFEEVKEPELPKEFFCVDIDKVINYSYYLFQSRESTRREYARFVEKYKSVGNYFETREEAEKYLEYLKAKAIIKQDTKGFKPNWYDTEQIKYSCSYQEDRFIGYGCVKPVIDSTKTTMLSLIYFKSKEDIEESLEKHPKEWKTYLFYEQ